MTLFWPSDFPGKAQDVETFKNVQKKLLTLSLKSEKLSAHTEQLTKNMRTKTLLLSAAALAAGVATSMAANVYSVNVVGYINVVTSPGYNMIANQLDVDGVDAIPAVLSFAADPNSLNNCLTYNYDKAHATYDVDYFDNTGFSGPTGWYDNNTGNTSTNVVPPGKGFFFYNAQTTNITLTLVGSVIQGTNVVAITSGYNLISTLAPVQQALLPATNGFPANDTSLYLAFTNTTGHGNYAVADYYDDTGFSGPTGWYNNNTGNAETPTPAVGQGYFIYTATSSPWTYTFTVQ